VSQIRRASARDLPGAYRVCLRTGDSGRDATARFRNPDLLGHVYVGPYVVGQPDLAWVVADPEGIAGYVLGTDDTRRFEGWKEERWWPALREQYPLTSGATADDEIVRLLHEPVTSPASIVTRYPAHLHIDLLPRAQGRGLGRSLVETLLASLRERSVPGVHLDVAVENANAIAFYRHLGFVDLEPLDDSILMGKVLDRP
jgi:ribosomal protein S18 acetylase RimI-like enzyme